MEKAGLIGAVRMRKLKTDDRGSLRSPELNAAITEDKRNGLIPFFVSVNQRVNGKFYYKMTYVTKIGLLLFIILLSI